MCLTNAVLNGAVHVKCEMGIVPCLGVVTAVEIDPGAPAQ